VLVTVIVVVVVVVVVLVVLVVVVQCVLQTRDSDGPSCAHTDHNVDSDVLEAVSDDNIYHTPSSHLHHSIINITTN